jgi:hypothetical protein
VSGIVEALRAKGLAAKDAKQRGRVVLVKYELLVALAEDPERVFKKEELLRNVWGFLSLGRNINNNPTNVYRELASKAQIRSFKPFLQLRGIERGSHLPSS